MKQLWVNKMEHTMKLQDKYYYYMLNGTKRIEIRLYDEKRKKINLGDTIIFHKLSNLEETFKARVIGLIRYNCFDNLLKDFDISLLADKSISKEELINALESFYSKEEQDKYGLLGIRIEIIK